MSIIRCPGCERNVDADFEDTEDARIGEDLVAMCWPCFEKHEAAVLAEGRALAAEHQRDLDARICTCLRRDVWRMDDPYSTPPILRRDPECEEHGIDPDRARDERIDRELCE
jgi:hypothetical protein